jgi:hypothetical protein
LREPKRIAVGIVDIELACPPCLVERTLVNGGVRLARRPQAPLSELAEQRVKVVRGDHNSLAELAVAPMTGEKEATSVARKDAK